MKLKIEKINQPGTIILSGGHIYNSGKGISFKNLKEGDEIIPEIKGANVITSYTKVETKTNETKNIDETTDKNVPLRVVKYINERTIHVIDDKNTGFNLVILKELPLPDIGNIIGDIQFIDSEPFLSSWRKAPSKETPAEGKQDTTTIEELVGATKKDINKIKDEIKKETKEKPKKLYLSFVPPETWRDNIQEDISKEEWKTLRAQVLKRDDYTCKYCGFQCDKWQIVHHLDGNPNNNDLSNLDTICQMCNLIHHAGFGCVVQEVVDLYELSNYSQDEIIKYTREMRAFKESDFKIKEFLGLKNKVEFRENKDFLKTVFGFITSRKGKDNTQIGLEYQYDYTFRIAKKQANYINPIIKQEIKLGILEDSESKIAKRNNCLVKYSIEQLEAHILNLRDKTQISDLRDKTQAVKNLSSVVPDYKDEIKKESKEVKNEKIGFFSEELITKEIETINKIKQRNNKIIAIVEKGIGKPVTSRYEFKSVVTIKIFIENKEKFGIDFDTALKLATRRFELAFEIVKSQVKERIQVTDFLSFVNQTFMDLNFQLSREDTKIKNKLKQLK